MLDGFASARPRMVRPNWWCRKRRSATVAQLIPCYRCWMGQCRVLSVQGPWEDWRARCSRMPVCHCAKFCARLMVNIRKGSIPTALAHVSSDRSTNFSWNPKPWCKRVKLRRGKYHLEKVRLRGDGNPGIGHFFWDLESYFYFVASGGPIFSHKPHSGTGLGGWSFMLRTFGMLGVERSEESAKPNIEILEKGLSESEHFDPFCVICSMQFLWKYQFLRTFLCELWSQVVFLLWSPCVYCYSSTLKVFRCAGGAPCYRKM